MKKLLAILLLAIMLTCTLASCQRINTNPIKATADLAASSSYYVEYYVDKEDIDWFAEEYKLTLSNISCIAFIWGVSDRTDGHGAVVFFTKTVATAKNLEPRLLNSADFMDEIEEESNNKYVCVREGKTVFIGSQAILDLLK